MSTGAENRVWRGIRALLAGGSPLIEPTVSAGGPQRSRDTTGADPDLARPDSIRARSEKWQEEILEFAEAIPEVAGASALVRAKMEGVKWVVKGGNDADRKRIQARVDAFDRERAAELIWLSGEVYIAVPDDPGGATPVEDVAAPFSLSVEEIKVAQSDSGKDQMRGPNGEWVDMVEEDSDRKIPFMRVWRPSKRNRWKAASPNKAVMDLLRAMYLAQLVDTATQNSRMIHAGIVFWPTNLPDIPTRPGEKPAPGSRQELQANFDRAVTQSIDLAKRGKDGAQPFVVFYDPGKGGESTKYQPEMFRIEREDAASDRATRTDVDRTRYATAVELPIESVTGTGDSNHWSAWQIDIDQWKTWCKPLDDLLRSNFEKRVVKAYGKQFSLVTDDSELIAKPDESDVVLKVMTLEQVTPESGIEALKEKDLGKLVAQDPPVRPTGSQQAGQVGARGTTAPGQPSDFGRGNTDRGGGQYRDRP